MHSPVILAHCGFSGGDGHHLENSARAFANAAALGCTWVETDVHVTSDGVVVAFHDDVLDRVTDQHGRVAELTWQQVSAARIGGVEPVPSMRALFERFPQLCFNIDVKAADAVLPLAELINELAVHDRVRVASFSDRRRRVTLRALTHAVRSSPGQTVMAFLWLLSRLGARAAWLFARVGADIDALQVPEQFGRVRVVDHRLITTAHAAGKQVHVWTVNDPDDMRRLLDLGVDGLITDRADVALPLVSSVARHPSSA